MIKSGDEPIPGYRLEALLGRGQFGEVWRARSPGNTVVALKFLELTGVHGWKEFRAIQRVKEIRHAHLMPIVAIWLLDGEGRLLDDHAIASIVHSHAVQETMAADGDTMVAAPPVPAEQPARLIVATLLADGSLGDRMKQRQAEGHRGIPVDELLNFMVEAAKGLDYLNSPQHKIGESVGAVQHCDVKPDNIMLTGGSVVIADFGVAQMLAQARLNTTATSLGGTPAYMAPELFVNRPCRSSDQYSLAVTYYELRTGKLPFREQTYAAVYQAHREGTHDFSDCTPAEQAVLRRATATTPEDRFGSCSEFVEALRVGVSTPRAPLAPKRKTVGVGAVLAATMLVALAGAAGYGVYRWLNIPPPITVGRVVIVVDPPDAAVEIDGQAATPNTAGEIVAERPVGSSFVVRAAGGSDRLDAEMELTAGADEQRRELVLPFSAEHFANLAFQRTDGVLVPPEAIADLAKAIKLDPGTYADMPRPIAASAGATAIERISVSPNGANLAIASRNGTILRWTVDAGEISSRGSVLRRSSADVLALIAGDQWTAGLTDDGTIALNSASGESLELSVEESAGTIKHIAITDNGKVLLAVSEVLELVPPQRKAWLLHAWQLDADQVETTHRLLAEQEGEFDPRMAGAHQSNWVAIASTDGGHWRVRIFYADAPEQNEVVYEQVGDLTEIVVSPDDRLIAVGGGSVAGDSDLRDYRATVITAAGRRFQVLRRAHQDAITKMAFDAAGGLLATGDVDGNAQAWTIPAGWDAERQPADEPVFLPDGTDAMAAIACPRKDWVACCVHGRVTLWDSKPGHPQGIELATPDSDVTTIAATPDGRWLVTGHDDGTLRFWNLPRIILVFRACAEAGVPMQSDTGSDPSA
jgi:WD40 repeat protein